MQIPFPLLLGFFAPKIHENTIPYKERWSQVFFEAVRNGATGLFHLTKGGQIYSMTIGYFLRKGNRL
jgi:hypothetical protein